MILLKIALGISYAGYLFLFVDSRMESPSFNLYSTYSMIYGIFWIIAILFNIFADGKIKVSTGNHNSAVRVAGMLVIFYIVFGILSVSSPLFDFVKSEMLWFMKFLMAVFITAYWVDKLKIEKIWLNISYFVPALMIIKLFIDDKMPFDVYFRLSTIFSSSDRYRMRFGFYQVNGLGGLCSFCLILSVILMIIYWRNNHKNKKLYLCVLLLSDFIVLTVLLCTASRNSIITFGIFVLFLLYYRISNNKYVSNKTSIVLKSVIILFCGMTILFFFSDPIMTLFIDSNRMSNFTINLPLLEESNRLFIGLGLVDPGLFGTKSTTLLGYTYYIDNYYLYLIMETGILGLIAMSSILCYIGVQLHKHIKKSNYMLSVAIFCCFLTQIIGGMGETNIIYHIFPSSFILLILYLLELNNNFENRVFSERILL